MKLHHTFLLFSLAAIYNSALAAPAPLPTPVAKLVDSQNIAIRQILPTVTSSATGTQTPNLTAGNQSGTNETQNNGPSNHSDNHSNNPICTFDNFDGNVCDDGDVTFEHDNIG